LILSILCNESIDNPLLRELTFTLIISQSGVKDRRAATEQHIYMHASLHFSARNVYDPAELKTSVRLAAAIEKG
jgi:hypothetical protein